MKAMQKNKTKSNAFTLKLVWLCSGLCSSSQPQAAMCSDVSRKD